MRKILLAAGFLLAVCVHAEFVADTDIPLMDGLQVIEGESFSFDVPAGQIVGFGAVTTKSVAEVKDFYQTALMELGWQKQSDTVYRRDQDELTLQISRQKKKTLVKIQYALPNR